MDAYGKTLQKVDITVRATYRCTYEWGLFFGERWAQTRANMYPKTWWGRGGWTMGGASSTPRA